MGKLKSKKSKSQLEGRRNILKVEVVPSKDDFNAVADDKEKTLTKDAHLYREKLQNAKKSGDKEKAVKLMKMKQLERMTQEKDDEFSEEVPIAPETLNKYIKTSKKKVRVIRKDRESVRLARRVAHNKEVLTNAVKHTAKAEFMLPEESGFLEADEGESTTDVSQYDIAKSVDIQSAQKHFCLTLKDYGSYSLDYSRNGRYLALSSSLGHTAVVDWQPKSLKCEFNVKETTYDAKFLHNEKMLAVAQRQWTYIYDNEGIELHCLKVLDSPLQLQFLPFHFLLACSNAKGYLSWLDVSIGQKVAGFQTHRGRLSVMAQNPGNAVIHLGHSRGTVTLWSPNSKESLVEMLCHNAAVMSLCMDKTGNYMATSGMDRRTKIWDMRTYKCLHQFKVPAGANSMHFSARGLLAASMGNIVSVYRDTLIKPPTEQYISHQSLSSVRKVLFCPYEDVLGVGSSQGFESLLIPGAGEPNFDTLEDNPYQTKKQRQNQEVKQLLDKIPAHFITLNQESVKELRPSTAEIEVKNQVPKKWLKHHYIPSKSIMESKRRWELKSKLEKTKKERHKKIQESKRNPKPYDPMDRFKFGG